MHYTTAKTIAQYMALFDGEIQQRLQQIYNIIKAAAPQATEAMSYQMPTFKLNGNLIHFAVMKNHLGLYPTPSAVTAFAKELTEYVTSKGAIQFPHDKHLPLDLIKRIVEFRVKENQAKKK